MLEKNILDIHEVLYDDSDSDESWEQVNLQNLLLLNDDSYEVNIYSEERLRVLQHIPTLFHNCSVLLNLCSMYNIFVSKDNNKEST